MARSTALGGAATLLVLTAACSGSTTGAAAYAAYAERLEDEIEAVDGDIANISAALGDADVDRLIEAAAAMRASTRDAVNWLKDHQAHACYAEPHAEILEAFRLYERAAEQIHEAWVNDDLDQLSTGTALLNEANAQRDTSIVSLDGLECSGEGN